MATNRVEKVNSLLLQEIGKIIQHDFDFGPENLVTVTRADVSANLIEAKIYVSAYPDNKTDQVLNKLNRAVYGVQKQINRKLNMRPILKIKFFLDRNPSQAGRVEELLNELKNQGK